MNQLVTIAKSSLGTEQYKQGTNSFVPILSVFIHLFLTISLSKQLKLPGLTKQSQFHMQTNFITHEMINIGPSIPHLK